MRRSSTQKDIMWLPAVSTRMYKMCIRDRSRNIEDINNKLYQYQDGVYYMDMVSESEKLGDYVLNVVQAVIEKKI